MTDMFSTAIKFNGDITNWDVSSVTDMESMFSGAKAFNRDVSRWDVQSALNMDLMLFHATAFRQVICSGTWTYSTTVKSAKHMFEGSSGSISTTGMCSKIDNRPISNTGGNSAFTST